MQFWEKYVEGVSPPPQIFDPGQWIPVAPGSWDTGIGAYKNCTGDLELNSVASIANAVDPISFDIQFDVYFPPQSTAKFKISSASNPGYFITVDVGTFVDVGSYRLTPQVTGNSIYWGGPVNFKVIDTSPCDIVIKSITFSYKDAGGNGGDSGQPPVGNYFILIDVDNPLNLCNTTTPIVINFYGFYDTGISNENYTGIFKVYYKEDNDYILYYTSPIVEQSTSITLPTLDCDIYRDNVVLLMHFDGDVDDETGKIPTTNTGVRVYEPSLTGFGYKMLRTSINQLVFNHADLNLSNSSFTIEATIEVSMLGTSQYIFSPANGSNGLLFYVDSSGRIRANSTGGFSLISKVGYSIPFNTPVRVALTYDGTAANLYIDGILRGTAIGIFTASGTSYQIFYRSNGNIAYIDELRITTGVVRSDFTIQTVPFKSKQCIDIQKLKSIKVDLLDNTSSLLTTNYLNFTNCATSDETGEFCDNFGEDTWQGKNGTVWSVNGFTNPNGETSIESYFSVKQQDNINFEVELRIGEYSEPGVPVPPTDPVQPGEVEDHIIPETYFPSYMWPVVSSNYTASAGEKLWASSEVTGFTITLPSTPNIGDDIWIWHPELGYTVTPVLKILAVPNRVAGVLHGVDTIWTEMEFYGGYIRCTYINNSYGWNIINGTWEGL